MFTHVENEKLTKTGFIQTGRTTLAGLLCSVIALVGMAMPMGTASAQGGGGVAVVGPAPERVPVKVPGRDREDLFGALGWRRGSFLIFPHLRLTYEDNDDIFADNERKQSDTILVLNPGFQANSIWENHELKFWGDIETAKYDEFGGEDYDNWRLGASGRIDVDRSRFITLGAEFGERTQDRTDPTDLGLAAPTDVDYRELDAAWYHQFNRLYYRVALDFLDEDYNDPVVAVAGDLIDNRDFSRNGLAGEVGYRFSEDLWGFARAELEDTSYDTPVTRQGLNRDSSGESVLLGVSLKRPERLDGSIYIGRRARDYDDGSKVSGSIIGSDLRWFPSKLTTIKFSIGGNVVDARGLNTNGYFRDFYGVQAEHELLRNVDITAGIRWESHDYESIDRNDDVMAWSIGATWKLNRWARLGLELAHDERDASGAAARPANSYDRDIVRLKVEFVR